MTHSRVACLIAAATSFPAMVNAQSHTGVYVGKYTTHMNAHKENGVNGTTWPDNTLDGEFNGEKYKVLGSAITEGIWVWDFDNNTVTMAGSTLFAMGMLYVPFQAFNPADIENKRADTSVLINDLSEITLPIEYQAGSGLYKLSYAQKKYVVPPFPVPGVDDYPIGLTTTHLKIDKNANGSVNITTADVEDGIPADNVPGTRIHNVFPAVVQVEYTSQDMQLDPMTDSNGDGISDAVATLVGLNPNVRDTDGDNLDDIVETPIYLRGKDSDNDGLSDALESGNSATDDSIASGLQLPSETRVSIATVSGERIYNVLSRTLDLSIASQHTLQGELPPEKNNSGEQLDYQYGHANFNIDAPASPETLEVSLSFDKLPEGLEIYRVDKRFSFEAGGFTQEFVKQQLTTTDDSSVSLTLSNPDKSPTIIADLILAAPVAHVSEPDAPVTTPPSAPDSTTPDTTTSTSSSGGSLGWLTLLAMAGLSFRKRKSHQGKG